MSEQTNNKSLGLKDPSYPIRIIADAMLLLVNAFGMQTLWGWYVVPLGVPAISLAHAVGIRLVASLLHVKSSDFSTSDLNKTKFWDRMYGSVIFTLTTLFMGWVFHGAMTLGA